MAPRKDAGPRVPVLVPVRDLAEDDRRRLDDWLADIIGMPVDAKPFEQAIYALVVELASTATGPSARSVRAEIQDFLGDDLRRFVRAYMRMSEAARREIDELYPEFIAVLAEAVHGFPDVIAGLEDTGDFRTTVIDTFLARIIARARKAGAHHALPTRSDYARARRFPIFEILRASIELALAHAKRHAPGAVPELERLNKISDATLVDRVHRAARSHAAAVAE